MPTPGHISHLPSIHGHKVDGKPWFRGEHPRDAGKSVDDGTDGGTGQDGKPWFRGEHPRDAGKTVDDGTDGGTGQDGTHHLEI